MIVAEILEGATTAWKRNKGSAKMKYRCTGGPRKGRVMSSPAACNAPINVKKRHTLTRTKQKMGSTATYKTRRTKKYNPGSRISARMNRRK